MTFHTKPFASPEETTPEQCRIEKVVEQYDFKLEDHDKEGMRPNSTLDPNQPLHGATIRLIPTAGAKTSFAIHLDTARQGEELNQVLWDTKKGGVLQVPNADIQEVST